MNVCAEVACELLVVTGRFRSIDPMMSEMAMFRQLAQPFEDAAVFFVLKIS
jgi:hypothetical protein